MRRFAKELIDISKELPTIIYDEYFMGAPVEQQRVRVGFLLPDTVNIDDHRVIESGFEIVNFPSRDVIVGKLKGFHAMSYIKIIPKLLKWIKNNNREANGPPIEIWADNKLKEVEISIDRKFIKQPGL